VVGAARLECGEPAAESGELIRRQLGNSFGDFFNFHGAQLISSIEVKFSTFGLNVRDAMDLEKIIDDLVYRKKKLDLDSPERQLINRILTGLRYSFEEAGGIIEDLDFDWGATVRLVADAQSPRPADQQVLPFRIASHRTPHVLWRLNSSGSSAMFAAILRDLCWSSFAAERRPRGKLMLCRYCATKRIGNPSAI